MDQMGKWIGGVVLGLLGLLGLVMASRAADATFYWTGIVVFVVTVFAIFYLMHKGFDQAEGK